MKISLPTPYSPLTTPYFLDRSNEVKYAKVCGSNFLGKQVITPPPKVNGFLKRSQKAIRTASVERGWQPKRYAQKTGIPIGLIEICRKLVRNGRDYRTFT
jgi:hypothetical protein